MNVDEIDTIAVLGAGNMGHGIAEVAALAGYEVRLRDINEELVETATTSSNGASASSKRKTS